MLHEFCVKGTVVSMLVSETNLHAGPGDSRAEILVRLEKDEYWSDPLWVGTPRMAMSVANWIKSNLEDTPQEEHAELVVQMDDYSMDRGNHARMGAC